MSIGSGSGSVPNKSFNRVCNFVPYGLTVSDDFMASNINVSVNLIITGKCNDLAPIQWFLIINWTPRNKLLWNQTVLCYKHNWYQNCRLQFLAMLFRPVCIIMTMNLIPHYWLLVRGIHRWLVISPHKGPVIFSFGRFFVVSLMKLLKTVGSPLFMSCCYNIKPLWWLGTVISATTRLFVEWEMPVKTCFYTCNPRFMWTKAHVI